MAKVYRKSNSLMPETCWVVPLADWFAVCATDM